MKVWSLLLASVEQHGTAAMVSIASTGGSVPREVGARLVLTPQGFHGSIGGGTLEWQAMATAQAQLGKPARVKRTSHILGPELGQCCGGRLELITEIFDQTTLVVLRDLAQREATGPFTLENRIPGMAMTESFGLQGRRIYLYGAGHVGRALVMASAPLGFDIQWIDNRPQAFPKYTPANVTCLAPDNVLSPLADATEGSFVWVMSHSHALDFDVVDAALRHSAIAHVGLIGSATKRARFVKRLAEAGVDAARVAELICPIGVSGITSKEPAAIAASAAAQLQMLHEQCLVKAKPAETNRPALTALGAQQ